MYGLDGCYEPRPQMVEGHTLSEDGRLWRLALREELWFHDGSPVLARDVVASLQRWARMDSFGGALFEATDELSASGDRVVQFRLKRPFLLLPALGKPTSFLPAIMPERLAQTPHTKQITEMVGSGPYRFLADERVSGAIAAYGRPRRLR